MSRLPLLFSFVLLAFNALAQRPDYSKQLGVQRLKDYEKAVKEHPEKLMVQVRTAESGIILDLRYATPYNFMQQVMYKQAKAYVRLPVYKALVDIEQELKTKGVGLKIFDAYRPYSVTVDFWETSPDTGFVADPRTGSKHNRGCAVDLTLIELKSGAELMMPTGFDSFSKMAASDYANLPPEALKNRLLLKTVMEAHGFKQLKTEWWHFDFDGWQDYELLDVPFDKF
ncbi:M15 family metallopeptidase [Mucilaginibacter sp. RS28]|uniref:D-alanyl-D-alanine dipeptidase n=1 Tax=Mucilaginibacter straminoryzae TaxID=2932774 RepID=A0A9X1XBM8_9SPHI|nr:M15 family metallopeptidase [Mucilaginibacter straminoryzae]MCJ8211774.1 M15 family metallopeptidase [Mucilaginibacter straminoryzae]